MSDTKNKGLWSEPCYVYTHDAGRDGKMTFSAIARYFQEAAWHSAEDMGFGYQEASRLKQFWVLVRQSIKANRFPAWGDHLSVESWPRGVDGLWAFRDYYIRDAKRNVCIAATSSWMIMDADLHRPLKPEIVYGAMPHVITEQAIGRSAHKVIHEGPWETVDQRTVRYSDLDVNGHMNNSRYMDWIFDALHKTGNHHAYDEVEINYLAESRNGDELHILHSFTGKKTYVKGERISDGRTVFIAEVR